jgi:uncharacterized Zn finger protein (UPF0148 family)
MNTPRMVTMYQTAIPCEKCGTRMNTDGRTLYCPVCLHTQNISRHGKHKPRKMGYRTARDRDTKREED